MSLPLFFVHLQKTGGVSLVRAIRKSLPKEAVYPSDDDGPVLGRPFDLPHLRARWPERRADVKMLTGHFPLATAELLGGRFVIATVLRPPVERTLSHLRHHRQMHPEKGNLALEDIYDDAQLFETQLQNLMVKMLGSTAAEIDPDGLLSKVRCTNVHLERAVERLAGIDVLGVTDDLDRVQVQLSNVLGLQLGETLHVNKTKPVDIDPAFAERIRRDNALDTALYAAAEQEILRRQE